MTGTKPLFSQEMEWAVEDGNKYLPDTQTGEDMETDHIFPPVLAVWM